jgi:hypothetical protein
MITKEHVADVEEAVERLDAAIRGIDALISTEEGRDLITNPRITGLRKSRSGLRGIIYDIGRLYE